MSNTKGKLNSDMLAKAGYTQDQIVRIIEYYDRVAVIDQAPEILRTPNGEIVVVSKSIADIVDKVCTLG